MGTLLRAMNDVDPVYTPEDWTRLLDLNDMFGREAPLEVDLGCGKGRFLCERSRKFPDRNFIGIDRQLARIRKTLKKLNAIEPGYVRLLRVEIGHALEQLFPDASVDVFYLLFPDPWPKRRHQFRRSVNPGFLDQIHRILKPGGVLNMATDHAEYFEAMMALLAADERFETVEAFVPDDAERTEFETLFVAQGLEIGRVSVRKVDGMRAVNSAQ